MLFICRTHGHQGLVPTSHRFSEALDSGESIPAEQVCLVLVMGEARCNWYHLDQDVVREAGLDPAGSPIVLKDRNVLERQLNDRLIIRRLFPGLGATVKRACKECLAQAIHRRDAAHLRIPLALMAGHALQGALFRE